MAQLDTRQSAQEPIVVVTAADDNYALPLAVTIRSAIDRLSRSRSLVVYVLNGGLSNETKQRLLQSWSSPAVRVQWLEAPMEQVADLKTENYLNLVTYLRLFMPQLLPPSQQRVIFLDADLLVQKDLGELWSVELGDAPIAAVNDYFTPYLNTRETIGRATHCDRAPEKALPIANYRELGLKGSAGYFNAGVMVVNLSKWREIDVYQQATDLLRKHRDNVRYCDQYALNILFSEKWKPLDARWNQCGNLCDWNSPTDGALDPRLFRTLRRDPWIIHFAWMHKPWHHGSTHPATRAFFRVVDKTAWRHWRPPAPPRTLVQRIEENYQHYRLWYRRNISPAARALKVALGLRKAA